MNKYKKVIMRGAGKYLSNFKVNKRNHLLFWDDELKKYLVVVPKEKVENLLIKLWNRPDIGLRGRDTFYYKIKQKFAGISNRTVADFIKRQEVHQIHLNTPKTRIVQPIVTSHPFQRWQIDLIDLQKLKWNFTGNQGFSWILTVVDLFSKYVYLFAIKNKKASSVAVALRRLFDYLEMKNLPLPKIIQSDRGNEFKGEVEELLTEKGIVFIKSDAYKPTSQGEVERSNANVKVILKRYKKFISN